MNKLAAVTRVAFVLALALGLATLGHGPPKVLAAVTNVNAIPSSIIFPNTSTVTITANETDGGNGPIAITVAGGALTFSSCQTGSGACLAPTATGNGTSSVSMTIASDGDGTTGEALTLQFQFSPPNVLVGTAVAVSACQAPVSCSPAFWGNINVFPSGFSSATNISFSFSATDLVCGNSVIVTATVTSSGVSVPDGTIVVFSANNGFSPITTITLGGIATATIPVPIGLSGSLIVSATSGGVTFSAIANVFCIIAGPPANISLNITPSSITCGSTASVLARVTDRFGNLVANNTIVTFTTTLGSIAPTAPTIGGTADAVITSFPQQPGTSTITARSGDAFAQGTVTIVCAAAPQPAAPTAVPPTVVPTARPPTTGVLPPNTGDAGLKR